MSFRTGPVMKLQSTTQAQPLVGSWITAVVVGSLTGPNTSPVTVTLGTEGNAGNDATQIFQVGDPILLTDPNGANIENCVIQGVGAGTGNQQAGGANNIKIGVQNDNGNFATRFPHVVGAFGTGTFVSLAVQVNNFFVQYEDGGTGPFMYLGSAWNMTTVFRRIVKLAKVAAGTMPFNFSATETFFGAPINISEIWALAGTVGDLYDYSLGIL